MMAARESFYSREATDSAGEIAQIKQTSQKEATRHTPPTGVAGAGAGASTTGKDPETNGFSGQELTVSDTRGMVSGKSSKGAISKRG